MVLPTLQSYWEIKRVNNSENIIKQRHTQEFERNEKWSNATKYFNSANATARQYCAWTSDKSYQASMSALSKQAEQSELLKEEKKERLKQRQQRLGELFRFENEQLTNEMKQLRANGEVNSNTFDMMKSRIENIKSAREEDRKKIAQEKLYEHWRQNNPELRQLESKQLNDFVVDSWIGQIDEKQDVIRANKELDREYVRYLETEREKAIERDAEIRRLKLNRELELKEILKQQMIELRQREAETEILKREEAELVREQAKIEQLEFERKEYEKRFQNQEYGRQLLRQHRTKLKQRAKEIQTALEHDLKILSEIAQVQIEQKNIENEKRLKAKADAEYMIRVFNEQLRLEKEREAELDAMFQDEAQREWDKRNAEWEKERAARERLMNQVLAERRYQIEEKFIVIEQKKNESLEKREELIRDMEITREMAMREKEKMEQAKVERKFELENQVCLIIEKLILAVFFIPFFDNNKDDD